VPTPVSKAFSQVAAGLTGADLAALLGQTGSPLSSSTVQALVDQLGALGSVPTGTAVPAGSLSSVGQALDTIAAEPGVPATAAAALQQVASLFGSANPITPAALGGAIQTLEGTLGALDGTPLIGPALSSLVGTVGTELAASPPASGTGTSPYTGAISYVLAPTTAGTTGTSTSTGAKIKSLKYHNGPQS
jgi:hypothetical protein